MSYSQTLFRLSAGVLTVCCLASGARADAPAQLKKHRQKPTRIALIGDVPYRDRDILKLDEVIREINEAHVDFTLHTGDIKSGSALCADELFKQRYDQLSQLESPLVYTPGDNEWTDCHREAAGSYDPLERLGAIRSLFFANPGQTLGKSTLSVTTQATTPEYGEFVENVRFAKDDIVYATIHVVGSNNNLATWSGIGESETAPRPERLAEVAKRTAAVLSWIDATFDDAEQRGAAGVLLAMQANPGFEAESGDPLRVGFEEIIAKLSARTTKFGRPVLVAHGDSHYQRFDKPLKAAAVDEADLQRVEDFTRAENFGDFDVHWVELIVDKNSPEVFRNVVHIVEANRFVR